ncbi:MAG: hypothetical protein WCJ31_21935 [Planctomycetia bacterium]
MLSKLAGDDGRIRSLPLAAGWTATRDVPAPSGPTFKERWAKQRH